MSNRAAITTQADVARAIRAALACGLTVVRIVARPDGTAIETDKAPTPFVPPPAEEKPPLEDKTWDD